MLVLFERICLFDKDLVMTVVHAKDALKPYVEWLYCCKSDYLDAMNSFIFAAEVETETLTDQIEVGGYSWAFLKHDPEWQATEGAEEDFLEEHKAWIEEMPEKDVDTFKKLR